jgi:hypothetical protein
MAAKRSFKLKNYQVVRDKIEEWIPYGINRYYKHRDEARPKDEGELAKQILLSVMLGLEEIVDWGE